MKLDERLHSIMIEDFR
jgi:hypothetical protein